MFTLGHPVIEVKEGSAEGTVVLHQKQFTFLPRDEEAKATLWPIPVTMRIAKKDGTSEEKKLVLKGEEESVYVGENYDHVVVNAGGSGFYRVVYSHGLNERLIGDVQRCLSVVERFNLVNDSWATVRARITPVTDYLEVVKLFSGEEDPNVWSTICGSMSALNRLVSGSHRTALQKVVRDLIGPAVEKLGWDLRPTDSIQTRELRGTLISTLGTIGDDAAVQKKAAEYFDKWKKDKASVEANVVPALVSILAYTGDEKRYDEFVQLSKEATTPQDTLRFINALARFRDAKLLERTIAKCLSDEVKTQDAPYLFASLLANEDAGPAAWKFLTEKFEDMVAAYPENGVVRMCGAAEYLDKDALADEVRTFFSTRKVKSGDMAVAQMLEQLEINLQLRKEQAAPLELHLLPVTADGAKQEAAAGSKKSK